VAGLVQPEKGESVTLQLSALNCIEVKPMQLLNASDPMRSTDLPMIRVSNPLKLLNALFGINLTLLPIVSVAAPVQPEKT
jgi:hypothetical protein